MLVSTIHQDGAISNLREMPSHNVKQLFTFHIVVYILLEVMKCVQNGA